jgi:hypothetical protein
MKKTWLSFISILLLSSSVLGAGGKTEHLIIVTIDGMRWQEIFKGMDQKLLNDPKYTHGAEDFNKKYLDANKEIEREKLFPFFWKTIAKEGQIYGNRDKQSFVDVTNTALFSYPGYNELFTGFPDPKIVDNKEIDNPNENIFEFLNQQPGFKEKIAVFTSWQKFHGILNIKRNKLLVNTTGDAFNFKGDQFKLLNDLQMLSAQPIGYRPDIFTFGAAREYLKAYKPRVLYIAFDETDDAAHQGWYDHYIKSAVANDAMLRDLWNTLQSIDQYKGKTTLVVTTDHGRGGIGKATWKHHGLSEEKRPVKIPESNEIWMAFMGPDTPALGEIKLGTIYQRQMATTLTKLLGFEFKPKHDVKGPISSVFRP